MLSKLRSHRPSHGTIVGYTALFVALGGTSYAVTTGSIDSREIKNNAVGSSDIRNNDVRGKDIRGGAIRSSDVGNQSLLAEDFASGQLPAGPQGPRGPQGLAGVQGLPGAPGQPGTPNFSSVLPSGTTIKGVFAAKDIGTDTDNSANAKGGVSFPVRVPTGLVNTDVNFVGTDPFLGAQPAAGDDDADCAGGALAPTAPADTVCLYIFNATGQADSATGNAVSSGVGSTLGFSFEINGTTSNPSVAEIEGTWAYTAP